MGSSLLGNVMQRVLVVIYGRFGTLQDGTGKLSLTIANNPSRSVTFQNSEDLGSVLLYW
jgi:hypothetical protein